MSIRVRCPDCTVRLAGYVLPWEKSADCVDWSPKANIGVFVIARDTRVVILNDWKQSVLSNSGANAVAWWRQKNVVSIGDMDSHAVCYNGSNRKANPIRFCNLSFDNFKITGPGANAHVEADREAVESARRSREDARELKEASVRERERSAQEAEAMVSRLKALGVDVSLLRSPLTPGGYSTTICMTPAVAGEVADTFERVIGLSKTAEKILDELGSRDIYENTGK